MVCVGQLLILVRQIDLDAFECFDIMVTVNNIVVQVGDLLVEVLNLAFVQITQITYLTLMLVLQVLDFLIELSLLCCQLVVVLVLVRRQLMVQMVLIFGHLVLQLLLFEFVLVYLVFQIVILLSDCFNLINVTFIFCFQRVVL